MGDADNDCEIKDTQKQFSINVEMDEYNNKIIDTEDSNDSDCPNFPIENKLTKSKDMRIKRNVIYPDEIIKEMEAMSRTTMNLADQLLSIELCNSLGRGVLNKVEATSQDKIIQNAIWKWRSWKQINNEIREPPLCYKCYICKKGWWYLHPFRKHLNQHDEKNLKVELEVSVQECNFAACLGSLPEYEEIPIEGKCSKCNKTFAEHASCKRSKFNVFYMCKLCNAKLHNCILLRTHEGTCDMYRRALSNSDIQISYKLDEDTDLGLKIKMPKKIRCRICNLICFSNHQLSEHMSWSHSVRSDIPEASLPLRDCRHCNDKIVKHNFHPCKMKSSRASCNYCCRKFQNKFIASLHMKMSQDDVQCRVCSTYLPKQCMEMEHLIEHSDNYRLVYKCLLCPNISYSLCESSIRKHRVILHRKHDVKQTFYELTLIPKACIENSISEYIDVELQDTGMESMENNTHKLNINVSSSNKKQTNYGNSVNNKLEITKEGSQYDNTENCFRIEVNDIKRELNEDEENSKMYEIEDDIFKVFQASKEYDIKPEIDNLIINDNIEIKNESIANPEMDNLIIAKDIQIKNESIDEEDYEDDIIVLRMDESNNKADRNVLNLASVAFNVASKELDLRPQNSPLSNKDISNITYLTKDVSLDIINYDPLTLNDNPKVVKNSYKQRKLYGCYKCQFEGFHKDFVEHKQKSPDCYFKKKSNRNFKCTKCNTTFVSFSLYAEHFKDHNLQVNACPQCYVIINNVYKQVKHIDSHVKNMFIKVKTIASNKSHTLNYRCRKCFVNVDSSDLFIHWENHLEIKNVENNVIMALDVQKIEPLTLISENHKLQQFNDELQEQVTELLQTPIRDRMQAKYFKQCILCDHSFARVAETKRHLIEHLLANASARCIQNGGLACQICHDVFQKTERYKQHMRDHAHLRAYKCEICNKSFSDSSNFSKHKKVHNFAVVICDICKKKFQSKASLATHIQSHQTTAPIQCSLCPKHFLSNSIYKKHIQNTHKAKHLRNNCKLCSIKYDGYKSKWDHMWQVHSIRKYKVDCPICHLPFRRFIDVKKHCKDEHNVNVKKQVFRI